MWVTDPYWGEDIRWLYHSKKEKEKDKLINSCGSLPSIFRLTIVFCVQIQKPKLGIMMWTLLVLAGVYSSSKRSSSMVVFFSHETCAAALVTHHKLNSIPFFGGSQFKMAIGLHFCNSTCSCVVFIEFNIIHIDAVKGESSRARS